MEEDRAKTAVLALCGLPASGKTALAKSVNAYFAAKQDRNGCRVELISFDDWLHAELAAAQFTPCAWQRSRQAALERLHELLGLSRPGFTLIVADDNNHLRSMRYELFQAARDHSAAFLQLYLPTSVDAALERNQRRSGPAAVPREALLRMAETLEPPQPERFAWEACTLTVTVTDTGLCWSPASTHLEEQRQQQQQQQQQQRPCDEAEPEGQPAPTLAPQPLSQGPDRPSQEQQTGRRSGSGVPLASPPHPPPDRPTPQPALPPHRAAPPQDPGSTVQPHGPQQPGSQPPPHCGPNPETVAALCQELWRLWGPAPPPPPSQEQLEAQRQAGRAANAASLLHGLDLRTRRALGEAVARAAEADRPARARALNEQRRALLRAAREALSAAAEAGPEAAEEEGGGGGGVGSERVTWLREQEAAFMRAAGA